MLIMHYSARVGLQAMPLSQVSMQAQFSTGGMRGAAAGVLALSQSPCMREDLEHDGCAPSSCLIFESHLAHLPADQAGSGLPYQGKLLQQLQLYQELGQTPLDWQCEWLNRHACACRLDFQRLRRLARWGLVGSSRVAPPNSQELRQLMAGSQSRVRQQWQPRPSESPWAKEPRLTHLSLQKYRDGLQAGDQGLPS